MAKIIDSVNFMPTFIAGIPCLIDINHEEWEVCDRKGYRAWWLEKKMVPADEDRINDEIRSHVQRELESYY